MVVGAADDDSDELLLAAVLVVPEAAALLEAEVDELVSLEPSVLTTMLW